MTLQLANQLAYQAIAKLPHPYVVSDVRIDRHTDNVRIATRRPEFDILENPLAARTYRVWELAPSGSLTIRHSQVSVYDLDCAMRARD